MLGGIPGLRRVPLFDRLPGVRGLMNIPEIDFPEPERRRLRQSVNSETAAFITPNHPEFFTDWMLDKYVLGETAPLAACWATHTIVNGLGPHMQKFWLKNNLIAQIPGAGGKVGKAYSVSWARQGHGVLLHPEGLVGWYGDRIAPLFSGASEMALETAKQIKSSGESRDVYIAPVVWKLFFRQDVSQNLMREMRYIEKRLRLPRAGAHQDPAERLYALYDGLLARDEVATGVHPTDAPFAERHGRLKLKLADELSAALDLAGAAGGDTPPPEKAVGGVDELRRAARWLRTGDKKADAFNQVKQLKKRLERLVRFEPGYYAAEDMSQEHVAECLKRIRADYCRHGMRDMVHNYVPQPVGPRRAVIRVPEPLKVDADCDVAGDLTSKLQTRMQACLDQINEAEAVRQNTLPAYRNPFLVR